jgi:hypothetical protein
MILQDLSRSNQSKNVQVLVLTDTNIDCIHVIKNMPCLTEPSVGFGDEDGTPVDLVSFLVACPSSMKVLAINYNRMVVKPHNIIL